jgi:predicted double-glycine peptidase
MAMRVRDIILKNNLVIQVGRSTCGPCSLLNVLRLKGDMSGTEDEFAKICKTRDGIGTSNADMIEAAKQVGLDVLETKAGGTAADVKRHIDAGAYVIVNYFHTFSGNGHYAVITDYDDNAFYLADCSLGFLRLRDEYFLKYWYGHDPGSESKKWFLAVK